MGDISDATDVNDRALLGGRGENRLVESRCKWRTLASECQVARAEVGYGGDAGSGREHGAASQLHGELSFGTVAHGLAMATDCSGGAVEAGDQLQRSVGKSRTKGQVE